MSEAINRAIAMLQDYKYDLASQSFSDNDEGDMLQRRNENKRSTVEVAIAGLRAELAALKAGQVEAVAWRYTSSQSFDLSNCKWHYQESFPHAGNRAVLEIGKLEALYTAPPASADAVSVPIPLLEQMALTLNRSDWRTARNRAELRALLAQSGSKGVKSWE